MKIYLIFFATLVLRPLDALEYQESLSDMLIQCNKYQSDIFSDNRTTHQCEKENFSESFSYVISQMETHYSKKSFWCFLFLKEDFFKLKFKLWFSHKNYDVDAYGVKFNKPNSDKWESRVMFKIAPFVVVPKANNDLPEIFGMEINGVNKCPVCGRKIENAKSDAQETRATKWPWHAAVYEKSDSIGFKCGGTLIQSKTVLTSARCVYDNGKKLLENSLQVGLGEMDVGIRSNVFRSIAHANFDTDTYENDIALLMLETQIKFSTSIMPVCLPQFGSLFEQTGTVLKFEGVDQLTLRDGEVQLVTTDECMESNPDFYDRLLHDDKFCASQRDDLSMCSGDDGGGLYVKTDGLWNLKGLKSVLKTCSDYTIFTGVEFYLEWIDESINSI